MNRKQRRANAKKTPTRHSRLATSEVDQALIRAQEHHDAGRLREAESLYGKILARHPNHVFAIHSLGLIAAETGNLGPARDLITTALDIEPDWPEAHNNLGNVQRALGDLDAAVESYRRTLAINPDLAGAHNNLGSVQRDSGDLQAAAKSFRRALQLTPDYAEAHNNLGIVHRNLGDLDAARECCRRALACQPHFAEAHNTLGNVLRDLGDLDAALESYGRALALKPRFAEAHNNLGIVHRDLGDLDAAIESHRRAVDLRPDYAEAYNNLGNALNDIGRLDEAERSYRRAVELKPDYAEAHNNLGNVFASVGRLDEAERYYRRAVELKPNYAEAYRNLISIRKIEERESVIRSVEKLHGEPGASPEDRMHFAFGLGKAYDDLGHYAEAFACLSEANRLKRQSFVYDVAWDARLFRRIREVFQETLFERHAKAGRRDDTPIFIIGMIRSGTTLVEQILASHRAVFGAGELHDLSTVADSAVRERGLRFPDGLEDLDDAAFNRLADDYLRRLRVRGGRARHVTDKMPSNFCHVGLIRLILPSARIIHVRRNPLDTCLSVFANYFVHDHPYAYDLTELGAYYRHYEALMEHWRHVLPGAMLELSYEALIEQPEAEIRRLLDSCELPFDPACLNFHETKRPVQTASVSQVRQPLYRKSLERWRNYEAQLKPLQSALSA